MEKVAKLNNREFAEIKTILNHLDKAIYDKIPKNIIKAFDLKNAEYSFTYDESKSLNEQRISPVSKAFIWDLFYYYCADESEKEIMKTHIISAVSKPSQSFDELMKTIRNKTSVNTTVSNPATVTTQELIEQPKKSFFTKLINKIKNLFKKG